VQRREGRGRVDLAGLGRAIHFGFKAYLGHILTFLKLRVDILILGAFVSSAAVGHYAVAVAVTMVLPLVPTALGSVLFPRLARLGAVEAAAEASRTVQKAMRHAVAIALAGSAVLAVILIFAVVPIWGPSFAESRGLGLILLPGTAALCLTTVANAALIGVGRPDRVLTAGAIAAFCALVLYATLIPAGGSAGAAIASSVTYAIGAVLTLLMLRGQVELPSARRMLPGREEIHDYRRLAVLVRGSGGALISRGAAGVQEDRGDG
jgi:O-antigen/teichoic acid export membrane protein